MNQERVRIVDVITPEYSDFLAYCAASGKVFTSELTNVDFVAFRTSSGQTRDYIKAIRGQIDNPVIITVKHPKDDVLESREDDSLSGTNPSDKLLLELKAEPENITTLDVATEKKEGDITSITTSVKTKDAKPEAAAISLVVPLQNTIIEDNNADIASDEAECEQPLSAPSSILASDDSEYSLAYLLGINASDFAKVSLDLLNLGVRSLNCLESVQCKTVTDVLDKSVDALRGIRSMGAKSVNEVIQKVKDFVSDPSNIDAYAQTDSAALVSRESKKVPLDANFKTVIESLLMGDDYSTTELTTEQDEQFTKLKTAVETVGEEICLEAYLKPDYGVQVCNMLWDFATPYIQYRKAMEEAFQRVSRLTEFTKERKAVPFIRAYAVKAGEKLPYLLSECSDETTVSRIPFLYEKLRQEENMLTLTTETNKFLGWLSFDVNNLISSISENIRIILAGRSERSIEVFTLRAEGKTLEEVGTRFGVTRERIRQIELKVYRTFWSVYSKQKYDLIMLVYALRDGDAILHFDELQDTIGDFASVLWACIKHDPQQDFYYYSKTLDAIVVRSDDAADMSENALLSTINDLLTSLPEVIEADKKHSLLADLAAKNAVPLEILENAFDSVYQQTGIFYHKNRMTVVFMCEYVLKHRFPAGFKIADDFEADRFKQYMTEFFGDCAATITNRAIDAKIGEIGVLCNRGKYIHPYFISVDQRIIDAVNDYVESSSRSLLPYGEIFEALKDTFEGTQITNRYLLHGALKKLGCKFSTGRDYVRKAKSVTFVDELEAFVEERGVVHKSEISAEFTSLGEAGLGQVVSRSSNVFNIDNGYYIHASQFDIQPEDYEQLRKYLTHACQDIPVNIRSVYETVADQFPEFMYRNDFEDRNKLFAALNHKSLTGNDPIAARFLHQNSFEFQPDFKMVLSTNHLPICNDPTIFKSNRIILIPFKNHFPEAKRDTSLKEDFERPEVLSAVANWLIQGYRKYKTGRFHYIPDEVKEATNIYYQESDQLEYYIAECLQADPNGEVPLKKLHAHYQDWCIENKYPRDTLKEFKVSMLTHAKISKKRPNGTPPNTTQLQMVSGYTFSKQMIS